jgi:hypothetical protein
MVGRMRRLLAAGGKTAYSPSWRRPGISISGLWYPIVVACMSLIVGFLFLPETKDVDITEH